MSTPDYLALEFCTLVMRGNLPGVLGTLVVGNSGDLLAYRAPLLEIVWQKGGSDQRRYGTRRSKIMF